MVVDFLVSGKYINGYEFYTPVRIWGPRGTDFDQRLRQTIDMSGQTDTWQVEERRVRRILSLFYRNEGHSKLHFVFYGDGADGSTGNAEDCQEDGFA